MSMEQSREFQLSQIRKLQKEMRSASPERCQEIEDEIATRTKDIKNLEELMRPQQNKTLRQRSEAKEYEREVPQTGKGIGGSRSR